MADAITADVGTGFAALALDHRLIGTLAALGYEEPTPIQERAVPPLLAGRDLQRQAATGTGKTAAFALRLLQRLASGDKGRAPEADAVHAPECAVVGVGDT